jgi:hypothetical protein
LSILLQLFWRGGGGGAPTPGWGRGAPPPPPPPKPGWPQTVILLSLQVHRITDQHPFLKILIAALRFELKSHTLARLA